MKKKGERGRVGLGQRARLKWTIDEACCTPTLHLGGAGEAAREF